MEIKIPCREFPLTYKWRGFISKLSYQNKIPLEESQQEALIIEWEVTNKIRDLVYRENYFKKVLFRRLVNYHNNLWERRKINLKVGEDGEIDFDNIICVRPFDVIFFEELTEHVAQMLMQFDLTASEIFLIRVKEEMRWSIIKKIRYYNMAHNLFYGKVKLIKEAVKKELVGV